MDRALIKLLKLRFRGALRRSFIGIKTVRGALFFILGLGMMLLWLGPQIAIAIAAPKARPTDAQALRDVLPLALLGFLLMSLLGASRTAGIHFTAAEVDFLFPGPFSRRQLLVYKLFSGAMGALFAALVFSVMLLRSASLWPAALIGSFLALIFMQLFSTAIVLAGQSLNERLYTRARKIVLYVVLGTAAIFAVNWCPTIFERGFQEAGRGLRGSAVWFWIVLPLEPFARTIAAERYVPDLIGWAAAAAAVNLALLALVTRLDVNYLESALAASQKRYALLQRRRSTGRMPVKPKMYWRVPPLPWLGGAGPIAWRQVITALRSVHGMLILLLIVLCASVAPVLSNVQKSSELTGALIGQIFFLTIMLTQMAAFDFRGDLDYMDWAKSLPLGSIAVVLGQLAAPVLLTTAVHVLFFSTAAVFAQDSRILLLAGILFSPPFNFFLYGVDNMFFLLFPFRAVATTPGDLQHVGRSMVLIFAKMIVIAAGCGAAAALGAAGYWIAGDSWVVAIIIAWLGLLCCGCLTVPLVAWAYRKFDVSIDTPA
jgi:hypothetical protein